MLDCLFILLTLVLDILTALRYDKLILNRKRSDKMTKLITFRTNDIRYLKLLCLIELNQTNRNRLLNDMIDQTFNNSYSSKDESAKALQEFINKQRRQGG